jgi:hypothetical protein
MLGAAKGICQRIYGRQLRADCLDDGLPDAVASTFGQDAVVAGPEVEEAIDKVEAHGPRRRQQRSHPLRRGLPRLVVVHVSPERVDAGMISVRHCAVSLQNHVRDLLRQFCYLVISLSLRKVFPSTGIRVVRGGHPPDFVRQNT